eukprot:GFUD01040514.1.p1 GENE.GFUD01040514.1~~GFUD01040514.1.p1  ORF type:complete len:308 (-),score=59.53 GFUD01040514.1:28-915(-)
MATDVVFLFACDSGCQMEVRAHKQILSLASKVFEKDFYGINWGCIRDRKHSQLGTSEEGNVTVQIEETSQEVFQVMVNFIYKKQIDWSTYNVVFLSNLYKLAEKYDIKDLMKRIITSIYEFCLKRKTHAMPLSISQQVDKDNLLDVASLALANNHFPELSEALYDVGAIYMKKHFKGRFDSVLDFFSETEISVTNSVVLHKMMSRMNDVRSPKCDNCCQSLCFNGQGLTRVNFVPGARVTWVEDKGHSQIDRPMIIEESYVDPFVGSLTDGSVWTNLTLKPSHYRYHCIYSSLVL